MIWVRKTLAYLLSLALLASLLLGALAYNLNSHFAKPDNLENWLSQSKVYDHFVSQVISQSQQTIGSSPQSDSISLSDATVQQAAQSAFSPQLLQDSVNTFLNANYAWLQGKTAKPTFAIDLSQAKQNFANQVGLYVTGRFSSLPVCSLSQLVQLQNQSIDPLSAPCRPATISAAAEGVTVTKQIATSSDFLANPVLTADNFQPKNSVSSQPYYQRLSFAPTLYHWSTIAPPILAVLAILFALAIFFLLPRRKGLRRVAGVILVAGIVLIATKFFSDFVVNKVQRHIFNSSNVGQLQQSLTDVLHRAEAAMTTTDLYFGIGFVILAVIILAVLIITRGHQPKTVPTAAASKPEEVQQTPSTDNPQPANDQPPKPKRPNLIQ